MFKTLFSPLKIGKIETANRFVVPAMVTNYCNGDGTATERFIAYLEAKAQGGWGMIITEDYAVDPGGKAFAFVPGLWNDEQVNGHAELTNRIHQYGSKIVAQIYHCGRQTKYQITGQQPVAPSPIPCPTNKEIPHELTVTEIREIAEKFGDAAARAKRAGFDAVEIHGAHGYLIAEFMSLYSNKRTDEYGGNLLNRMRFPLEIIDNIRKKTDADFPIIFRISGEEFVPGGRTIEDTKAIAMILEKTGIDAIHVSAGTNGSAHSSIEPSVMPHGWLTDLAAAVKRVVSIPVITVSRINDPWLAESILLSGKADLVAMGRASLADPFLPEKTLKGKFSEINYCLGCMQGCIARLRQHKDVKCLVNPALGREHELRVLPAERKLKVFIAGAGPAGAEAAIVAAARGHEVDLYEKNSLIGGEFRLAAVPPGKGEFSAFVQWQEHQLEKLAVKIHLNTPLSKGLVEQGQPDAVIIATGSEPVYPVIAGCDKANVITAQTILNGDSDTGDNVVIIGGGLVGAETAAHLANHGKNVTLVELLPQIATDMEGTVRKYLLRDLEEKKVVVYTNTLVKAVEDFTLRVERNGGEESIGPFDNIVLAVGAKAVNGLAGELEGQVAKLITIGDALEVRKALEAIEEGYLAGLGL